MIDWFSGILGYDGSGLHPDRIALLHPDGSMVWSSDRYIKAESSFSSSVEIRPYSPTSEMISASRRLNLACASVALYVSGNPAKFLQGHNVFGPSVSSLAPVVQSMVRGFPKELRPRDADSSLWPAVHRSRVDVTLHTDVGSHRQVHEWLQDAGKSTRSRHGRAVMSGDTVYYGKKSRHWKLKAYCKFCELKEHHPPDLGLTKNLRDFCETHIRFELELHSPELKERGTLNEELVWEYLGKTGVGKMKSSVCNELGTDLPTVVQATLILWRSGVDVRQTLTRPTFFRHRKLILDSTGLDISLSFDGDVIDGHGSIDLGWLKDHEVKLIPAMLQGHLFKPVSSPVWKSHNA